MFEYRALGSCEFAHLGGSGARAIALQPKQIALLTFLAGDKPGEAKARDSLLGVFWPDADAPHARAALRQAIYEIRKTLGDDLIRVNGHHTVLLDCQHLRYDVWRFNEALAAGNREAAVALWRGPFLDGFFLSGSAEFDRWLEAKRGLLAARYRQALAESVTDENKSADIAHKLEHARRWVKEEPYRALAVCKLMELLEHSGQRAEALNVADRYATVIKEELEAEPEAVVQALATRIRASPLVSPAPLRAITHDDSTELQRAAHDVTTAQPLVLANEARRTFRRYWAVGILIIVVFGLRLFQRPTSSLPSVFVASFHNATRDSSLDPVGAAVAQFTSTTLTRLGTVDILPSTEHADEPTFTVTGSYQRVGDSLDFLTEITDNTRKRALPAPRPIRVPLENPMASAELIANRAAGALGYYTSIFGSIEKPERAPPNYNAYLSFCDGLEWMFQLEPDLGARAFRRAIAIDPSYTEAYILLAGFAFYNQPGRAWRRGGINGRVEAMDSLATEMAAKVTPLTRADQLVIAWLRAAARGDLDAGLSAAMKLSEMLPASNFGVGFRGVWANKPNAAITGLQRLNPDVGWIREWWPYWYMLTAALHENGDYEDELRAGREGHQRFPAIRGLREAELRAAIALGQLDEVMRSAPELWPGEKLILGLELRAHGHKAESKAFLQAVINAGTGPAKSLEDRRLVAIAQLALGNVKPAIGTLEGLVAEDTLRLDYKGMLATAYARDGQSDAARRLDAQLARISEPYLNGLPTIWRARIAARLGDQNAAVQLLVTAFRQGTIFIPAFPAYTGSFWHTDPDFEQLAANGAYLRAIAPR